MTSLTLIHPNRAWFRFDARALWRYRDLLRLYIRRDLTLRYRQTLLGPLWLVIQPLAMTGVLTLLVRAAVGWKTGGQPAPLFFMSGLAVWGYFSLVTPRIGAVFIDNEYLFSKIYFPRLIIPISVAMSAVVGLMVQLTMLAALLVFYVFARGRPVPELAGYAIGPGLIVLATAQLMAFSLGLGLVIASAAAKYRDLANAMPFLLQIGLFLTPVLYPLSAIPQQFRLAACALNPLAAVTDLWRIAILGSGVLTWTEWAASAASALVVLSLGVLAFQRVERTAADTI